MNKHFILIVLGCTLAISSAAKASNYKLTEEQKRLIAALLTAPKSAPGTGLSTPSGFGAGKGQLFASIGGTTTEDSNGSHDYDGSASLGAGFGDAQKFAALELQANIISLTNNSEDSGFGEQGSVSAKLSRNVGMNSGISFGVENLGTWGDIVDETDPNTYVAFTTVHALSTDPFNPLLFSFTAGLGNERFRDLRNGNQRGSVGLFASFAFAPHRQAGLIVDYNGNYVSIGASFVPLRQYPLTVTLSVVNANEVEEGDGGTTTGDAEFGASIGYSWRF